MKLAEDMVINGRRAIGRSYAKINLTLDVLEKRPDGYHELETVMQTVNLFDLILVDRIKDGIRLMTNLKFLPNDSKNIAYQAAKLFFDTTGIKGGAKIRIHKNIPVAAGLAGGSGNAAAVLVALNMLYGVPLSDEELLSLSVRLGADVPYCMVGGTQSATGIGEILRPVAHFPKKPILLVKPSVNISTAEIYQKIDNEPRPPHPTTSEFLSALEENNWGKMCETMFNVMELVSEKKHPIIGSVKKKMQEFGASFSMMSGSGSTVFGFFDDYRDAERASKAFSQQYQDVFLTYTN